jgi:hypothetical protein
MNDVRERLQELARVIETHLPPGTGFVLLEFDFGPGGRLEYISNARRADLIKAISEKTITQWGEHAGEGPAPPH